MKIIYLYISVQWIVNLDRDMCYLHLLTHETSFSNAHVFFVFLQQEQRHKKDVSKEDLNWETCVKSVA